MVSQASRRRRTGNMPMEAGLCHAAERHRALEKVRLHLSFFRHCGRLPWQSRRDGRRMSSVRPTWRRATMTIAGQDVATTMCREARPPGAHWHCFSAEQPSLWSASLLQEHEGVCSAAPPQRPAVSGEQHGEPHQWSRAYSSDERN